MRFLLNEKKTREKVPLSQPHALIHSIHVPNGQACGKLGIRPPDSPSLRAISHNWNVLSVPPTPTSLWQSPLNHLRRFSNAISSAKDSNLHSENSSPFLLCSHHTLYLLSPKHASHYGAIMGLYQTMYL